MRQSLLALVLLFTPFAYSADYCLAIRGNGELAPAHWGAISRVVETLGLPRAQAGGSSASVTMFLLDAVASSPVYKSSAPAARPVNAALLIMSFEGFASYLMSTSEFADFKLLYSSAAQLKDTGSLEKILEVLNKGAARDPGGSVAYLRANADLLRRNFATVEQLGLVSSDNLVRVRGALNAMLADSSDAASYQDLLKSRFFVSELISSVQHLGSYDTEHDPNLFFRPGVVDFTQFAVQVGRIGDFYVNTDWSNFFSQCAGPATGKLWTDLLKSNPACGTQFSNLVTQYFAHETSGFAARPVGVSIDSFPSTAVLSGSGARDVRDGFAQYENALSPMFGDSFRVSDPATVRFGYWGREDLLSRIQRSLPADDAKSQRFLALGRAPWKKVLSLSPAEPGASPFLEFTRGQEKMFSAGGWAYLAPVLLLKAAGCGQVVYVTRRGPEAGFAQGVARRLMGFDGKIGNPADRTSLWSRLYNVNNPQSSYRRSLGAADALLCTKWDLFNLKSGMEAMIADAYDSPFQIPVSSGLQGAGLGPLLNTADRDSDGSPTYLGCY